MYDAVEIGPWSYPLGTGDNGPHVFRPKPTGRFPKVKLGRQLEPQLQEKGDSVFARG